MADVEDIRKRVGTMAAEAVSGLRADVDDLRRTHKAFAYELETFRREVAIAKAAPAELRRDVLAFRGDLVMKAEQIEALGLRLAAADTFAAAHNALAGRVDALEQTIEAIGLRLQALTFRQRLRWILTGRAGG